MKLAYPQINFVGFKEVDTHDTIWTNQFRKNTRSNTMRDIDILHNLLKSNAFKYTKNDLIL